MKKCTLAAMTLAAALSSTAHAAGGGEPALELRNAFISQYSSRAAASGKPIDSAAKEGGCIFDVMADRLSVSAYIRVVQDIRNGGNSEDLSPLLPEIRQRCFTKR